AAMACGTETAVSASRLSSSDEEDCRRDQSGDYDDRGRCCNRRAVRQRLDLTSAQRARTDDVAVSAVDVAGRTGYRHCNAERAGEAGRRRLDVRSLGRLARE